MSHNGHANYETWQAAVYMDNADYFVWYERVTADTDPDELADDMRNYYNLSADPKVDWIGLAQDWIDEAIAEQSND